MIISEKQIWMLLELIEYAALNYDVSDIFRKRAYDFISEIRDQQSEELKVIE